MKRLDVPLPACWSVRRRESGEEHTAGSASGLCPGRDARAASSRPCAHSTPATRGDQQGAGRGGLAPAHRVGHGGEKLLPKQSGEFCGKGLGSLWVASTAASISAGESASGERPSAPRFTSNMLKKSTRSSGWPTRDSTPPGLKARSNAPADPRSPACDAIRGDRRGAGRSRRGCGGACRGGGRVHGSFTRRRRKRCTVAASNGVVAVAVWPTGVVVSWVTPAVVHSPVARWVAVSTT